MAWPVGPAQSQIPLVDQLTSPTQDGSPDENRTLNCGESCVSSLVHYYFSYGTKSVHDRLVALGYSDGVVEPDAIKDWLDGQGVSGVITYNNQLSAALAHFGNISSITQVPVGCHNGANGLLDREWQSMTNKIPVIALFYWIDDTGKVWNGTNGTTEVDHWRLPFKMTSSTVESMDPYHGIYRTEEWSFHCAVSKQLIVAPTLVP